jgi:predicted acetyltransferase
MLSDGGNETEERKAGHRPGRQIGVASLRSRGQTGAMDPVIRKISPEEAPAFRRSVMVPFLEPFAGDPDQVADYELSADTFEADRAWVVDTGDQFVGNAGIHSLDVTLPARLVHACPTTPMAGVTAVGVHPTHRRQGFLRQLMAAIHIDARKRGEAIAGLEASESVIYGRFGYGLAANLAEYSIDSRASAFAVPAPDLDLALIDKVEAVKVLPKIFDRQRRTRAGEVSRSSGYWTQLLGDLPHHRGGAAARFHAVCEDGYVLYRADHEANVFQGERVNITVEELRGISPEVEAGLWRFVLDLDLIGQVKFKRRAVDEPVRWRLADPRQLRTTNIEDRLYVRILDPAAAFEARGYQGEGRVVLDVMPLAEEEADATPGRWVLEAGTDGASCRRARTGEEADLRLGIAELGSLYVGGFPASLLAAGGRVEELRSGRLSVIDALLTTRPSPRSGTGF